jgi:hypothetical protein
MNSGKAGGVKKLGPLQADSSRVPGPGARALYSKTMRHFLFHGPGGQFKCGMQSAECGMAKKKAKDSEFHIPNSEFGSARTARLILRKLVEASRKRADPADAF